MTNVWLSYIPAGLIQEREGTLKAYEIWLPELGIEVGIVEHYVDEKDRMLWRTLDSWKCDYKDGYLTRESAAQDLVQHSPRTLSLITRASKIAPNLRKSRR